MESCKESGNGYYFHFGRPASCWQLVALYMGDKCRHNLVKLRMSFILVGSLPPEKTPRKPSYQGLKQYSNQLFYLFNVDRGKTSKAISFVRLNNHTNTSLPALRNDDDFSLLITACSLHTSARTHDDITVQACFDSDRLDLGRVGTVPDAEYLCTPVAKMQGTIKWGYNRSLIRDLPDKPFGLSGYDDRVIMDGGI
jgi:hypothetical protein